MSLKDFIYREKENCMGVPLIQKKAGLFGHRWVLILLTTKTQWDLGSPCECCMTQTNSHARAKNLAVICQENSLTKPQKLV